MSSNRVQAVMISHAGVSFERVHLCRTMHHCRRNRMIQRHNGVVGPCARVDRRAQNLWPIRIFGSCSFVVNSGVSFIFAVRDGLTACVAILAPQWEMRPVGFIAAWSDSASSGLLLTLLISLCKDGAGLLVLHIDRFDQREYAFVAIMRKIHHAFCNLLGFLFFVATDVPNILRDIQFP